MWVYDTRQFGLQTCGNLFYNGAWIYAKETNPVGQFHKDPNVKLVERGGRFTLHFKLGPEFIQAATLTLPVTTALLGKARVSGAAYENPDGSPLKINTDYFGKKRSKTHPSPGPFETTATGPMTLRVW